MGNQKAQSGSSIIQLEACSSQLMDLQNAPYKAITSPENISSVLDLAIVSGETSCSGQLSPPERVRIYADAYFSRLLECLREDYPVTERVLGEALFADLVGSYLVHFPPSEPSLLYAGRDLAEFLESSALLERWPFIAELARLERLLIEVFHDPDAPSLGADEIRELAPAEWPALAMRTHPAMRILHCRWRVHDLLSAAKSHPQLTMPAGAPVTLLVWRRATQVHYRELQDPERAALELASGGASFAAICEAFAARINEPDPAPAINYALSGWLADGLLTLAR